MKHISVLLALLVGACTTAGSATTTSLLVPTTSTTTTPATTTTLTPTTSAPGCGAEMSDGELSGVVTADSDAEQLGAITWETDPSCERFRLAFTSTEGAPATSPPTVSGEFIRSSALLRIHADVESTAVTDQLVQSGLVDRLYVVRQADRTLFVDFHLLEPAVAKLSVADGTGEVIVELQRGGSDYDGVASFADNVVVVSPTPGAVDLPLMVSGYSRNFEANTIVRVTQDGSVVLEDFTTAADWLETWGEFEIAISPPGSGPAELFVGEQSAQDGSDRGLVIDIEY